MFSSKLAFMSCNVSGYSISALSHCIYRLLGNVIFLCIGSGCWGVWIKTLFIEVNKMGIILIVFPYEIMECTTCNWKVFLCFQLESVRHSSQNWKSCFQHTKTTFNDIPQRGMSLIKPLLHFYRSFHIVFRYAIPFTPVRS